MRAFTGRLLVCICILPIICISGCSKKATVARAASPTVQMGRKTVSLAGKKILLVHSYHPEYPWVASITRGVQRTLKGTGVQLDIFYMDTKRKTSKSWMTQAGALASKKMQAYQPDVVITCDDNAQQCFAKKYVGGGTKFVFTGVDADPSKYGFPASNVTGIIERPQLEASLKFARTFRPIKRIAVLSCNDSTSIAALGFMKQDPVDVQVVEWKLAKDFNDWKKAVLKYNKTVDAIVVRSYQAVVDPQTGDRVAPTEVAAWTADHATVPTIAFHDFEINDGMFAGVVKSGDEYGRMPAQYALNILRGARVESLPVVRANIGIKMVNRTTAKHLGISLTQSSLKGVSIVPGG